MTVGFNFAKEETYRCWSQGWFPAGTILVCDNTLDIDCFIVNYEKTIEVNFFDPDWLIENQPDNIQMDLLIGSQSNNNQIKEII